MEPEHVNYLPYFFFLWTYKSAFRSVINAEWGRHGDVIGSIEMYMLILAQFSMYDGS